MCGILGVISKESKQLDEDIFKKSLSKQKHRGPDASEIVKINNDCLFGFNRLIIQDLSDCSMQPFHYKDNWIVFNGEIYNFIELRKELESKGLEFKTTGDVEVLIAGLTLEGVDFLQKVNGIFAFCFYNSEDKTYLFARDRFGVKPLFYYSDPKKTIFSSEIMSILEYIPTILNNDTIHTHVFLDWFAGYRKNETFFKDVHILENGKYQIRNEGGQIIKEDKYYNFNYQNEIKDAEKAEQEFSELLEKSIELETRSDETVGIALSGGIDSATITTLATPHLIEKEKRIPIFTKYFQKKGEDVDLVYADKTISHLEKQYGKVFDVKSYNMDSRITLDDFIEATLARETPVFDIRQVTITKLYKEISKSGVKVSLSGQGADEIYYGYYPLDYWLSRFYRHGEFTVENILEYFEKDLNAKKYTFINQDFISKSRQSSYSHLQEIFKKILSVKPKEKRVTAFLAETILQSLLMYEDKFGMHSGVEVRVPLINPLLVDYINRCDFKLNLISSTSGRHLLRKAVEDKLPADVVARVKNPTPKKKKYLDELQDIIKENSQEILKSSLIREIYKEDFIENICENQTINSSDSEPFYGNTEDILVEFIGLFVFEKVYLGKDKEN